MWLLSIYLPLGVVFAKLGAAVLKATGTSDRKEVGLPNTQPPLLRAVLIIQLAALFSP